MTNNPLIFRDDLKCRTPQRTYITVLRLKTSVAITVQRGFGGMCCLFSLANAPGLAFTWVVERL